MLELLTAPFANAPAIAPGTVAVRLLAAAVLGGLVSLVYRRTRPAADVTSSFSTTLVLLSILIAMDSGQRPDRARSSLIGTSRYAAATP